ncbi:putative bZIP transcription factor [Endogone sp. FLAS-F59071]|nr:putative bZIP transcription factor [Endogone sp. FLAS-F59071]|eukprot:RUS14018.1 putative bZIP transcription factor [Endogone sp. FLAS-F59071]
MATTAAPPFIKPEPTPSHIGGMSPPKLTVIAPGANASEVPSLTVTHPGSSSTSTTNQPNGSAAPKFTENALPAPLPTIEQTPTRFLQACSKLDLEPNPFEQSFGGLPSAETPGNAASPKTVLPPVASIASPSLPVPPAVNETFNWDSLRAGPLSPSMLQGPTNPSDFNNFSRPGDFPYPNMSSAMYVNGAAPVPPSHPISSNAATNPTAATPVDFKPFYHQQMPRPLTVNERAKIATAAANGVSPQQNGLMNTATSQPMYNSMAPSGGGTVANGGQGNNLYLLSSQAQQEVMRRGSVNGTMVIKSEKDDFVNASPATQQARGIKRPAANGNGAYGQGKGSSSSPPGNNGSPLANGRNTRQRTMSVESNSSDEMKKLSKMPKDMDDEEKRRNFLERNRQAALKCRQRKKAWLANLQAKVDYLANENETLQSHATSLKEEIINLKTLLLAHKDCPIAQANGVMIDAIGSRNGSGAPVTMGSALQGLSNGAGLPPGMVPVSAGMGMSNGNGIPPMGPPMGPGGQMMRY